MMLRTDMRKVGLFEAKQKLSELAERAGRGERIGITKRGKLIAEIGPVRQEKVNLKEVFERIEKIRRKVKPHPGITTKDLIEEGRR
jgi:prevent-host-death family protein